ncbi:High mobility group box domain,Coiled-coil domain-containing protein 124 [Cinara cedri]|uniref:High mobility group box domain,Coiled-coil domain-containing protein 124 n=1 Tax=Cinara cedri TaxID=506608 RepID=A0A5E4M2J0_9HEMI|nr:High mobility group box domain,Coiled-coil domain-containing protein 124 [Cinara cedri]
MPKKFVGMNSKALEAKARRDQIKQEADAKKKQAIEDELWRDDDKSVVKKQKRKANKEKKRIDQMEKKREAQLLLEAEYGEIKTKPITQKITRHQLMKDLETPSNPKPQPILNDESTIEENLNRLTMHDEEARTVDEALNMLNSTQSVLDKNPEKRLKAAYSAFEADNLPRLRAENPTMRLSQVKQLMNKEWMKSPDNPINQRYVNRN